MSRLFHRGISAILAFVVAIAPLSSPAFVGSEAREVMVNGVRYAVSQKFDRYGRIVGQSIVSREHSELLVDENADGVVDHWEARRGPTTIRAFMPIRGEFSNLEIEERRKNGVFSAKFLYVPQADEYQLYSKGLTPYRIVNKNNVWYGECTDPEQNAALRKAHDEWQAVLSELYKKSYDEAYNELMFKLLADKERFLDKSCFTSEFEGSVNAMLQGLAEVLLSDLAAKSKQGSKPTYLACLRAANLPVHAMKIEQQFAKWKALIKANAMGTGYIEKPIACHAYSDERHAAWDSMQERVIIHKTASQLGVGGNAKRGYANAYFHEMVHASGIETDETFVEKIESCCSNGYDAKSPSCKEVQETALKYKRYNSYQVSLTEIYGGDYVMWRRNLGEHLGPEASEVLAQEFFKSLDDQKVVESERLRRCVQQTKTCDKDCATKCFADFQENIDTGVRAFFATDCAKTADVVKRNSNFCGEMADRFIAMTKAEPAKKSEPTPANAQTSSEGSGQGEGSQQASNSPAAGGEQDSQASTNAGSTGTGGANQTPVKEPKKPETLGGLAQQLEVNETSLISMFDANDRRAGAIAVVGAQHSFSAIRNVPVDTLRAGQENGRVTPDLRDRDVKSSFRVIPPIGSNERATTATVKRSRFAFEQVADAMKFILPSTAQAADSPRVRRSPRVSSGYKSTSPGNHDPKRADIVFSLGSIKSPFGRRSPASTQAVTAAGSGPSTSAKAAPVSGPAIRNVRPQGAQARAQGSTNARERNASGNAERSNLNAGAGRASTGAARKPSATGSSSEKGRKFQGTQGLIDLFKYLQESPYSGEVQPSLVEDLHLQEALIIHKVRVDALNGKPIGHRKPSYTCTLNRDMDKLVCPSAGGGK